MIQRGSSAAFGKVYVVNTAARKFGARRIQRAKAREKSRELSDSVKTSDWFQQRRGMRRCFSVPKYVETIDQSAASKLRARARKKKVNCVRLLVTCDRFNLWRGPRRCLLVPISVERRDLLAASKLRARAREKKRAVRLLMMSDRCSVKFQPTRRLSGVWRGSTEYLRCPIARCA